MCCSNCGHLNSDRAKSCEECGYTFAIIARRPDVSDSRNLNTPPPSSVPGFGFPPAFVAPGFVVDGKYRGTCHVF